VQEAITSSPNISTFYDTLGRIQSQLAKPADAIKSFRTALDKDPNDVEAMIGLADLLQSKPAGRDEARALLTRINAIVDAGAPIAPTIRKQLDKVKMALSSTL
jgi:cytochrome c-type biogenesis protein CcmH/NrfG